MNNSAHPETSTLAEFATIAGYRRSYITQLKHDNRLVFRGRRVLVAESLERIAATRDPSKDAVAARHAATRGNQDLGRGNAAPSGVKIDSAPLRSTTAPTDRAGATYQASRAVRERYLALEAKRAYDVAIGRLMEVAEVESVVADAITTLRLRLESLQDVLGPMLAVTSDEVQIRAALAAEIDHALAEASRHFARMQGSTHVT